MDITFQNFANLSFSRIRTLIGEQACDLLETEQSRLVFIIISEHTTDIYQNENIKNFLKFNFNGVKNLTNSEISLCLNNESQKITPLIVVLTSQHSGSAGSLNLIVSPKSHGELLLIDGAAISMESSHTSVYKHHIIIEEYAVLNSAWMFIQPENTAAKTSETISLERFVEIKENGTFYDQQIFAPQSNIEALSKIKLLGKFAKAYSAGCLMSDSGQFNYEPVQEHYEMHGKSALNFKVVLSKRAKSFFRGLVILHKEAQKSEAYQENKNLLLSRSARADSEPRLEIIPNDVMCKHGSATAELDHKQMYYLMSRGFNKHQAKTLIVKSFCNASLLEQKKENTFLQDVVALTTVNIFDINSGILAE